jgi:tetratricopeptide (TPR) repeat protein
MPLEAADQTHLRAAHGYIELEVFDAANAELEEIDPLCRQLPEVLMARLAIYLGLKKWELMAIVVTKLVEWNPGEPDYFIKLAYAQRRAESLELALQTLGRAAVLHPTDTTIRFNLACYEAQLGNLARAKQHLNRATEIDSNFKLVALEDPDLEPLWTSWATGARV